MKFIIGSLVGAVIGYITNWLAIKMLFRPHNEVRIGKIKVPFTPGLIPKEKTRIAKSVGATIGQHLLTKDTILESLCSENMNVQLDSWVQNKVKDIENSDATVENEIETLLGEHYSSFVVHTEGRITKALVDYINEDTVKASIIKFINEQVRLELSANPEVILKSDIYNEIKIKILNYAIEYKDSKDFHSELQRILKDKMNELGASDKSFEEVIPKGIIDNTKVYVYGKKYEIAMAIKKLMKEEKNRQKLRQIVAQTISTKLSPMIAMFMNVDSVYEKVLTGINEFLDDESNHNDIALIINDIIDKLLKNSISSVVSELPKEGIEDTIESLINLFTTKIVDGKLITEAYGNIEAKLNEYSSIDELLEKSGVDYNSVIEGFIKKRIEAMAESNSVKTKISEVVTIMINNLLQVQMKSMFKEDGDKISQSVSKIVRDLYNKFIENKAADVIEILDVAKIVEDKINEFDVAFAEEIILEIASKELKAITWLGGLLGAIMGLLSPIMGSL